MNAKLVCDLWLCDRLNGFENGTTQLFNSWGVGKQAYLRIIVACSFTNHRTGFTDEMSMIKVSDLLCSPNSQFQFA